MNRIKTSLGRRALRIMCVIGPLAAGLLLAAGCTVPVQAQRLLAKPAMQFSGSAVFGNQPRLLPQLESGAATSGGGQAAVCSSCR